MENRYTNYITFESLVYQIDHYHACLIAHSKRI